MKVKERRIFTLGGLLLKNHWSADRKPMIAGGIYKWESGIRMEEKAVPLEITGWVWRNRLEENLGE